VTGIQLVTSSGELVSAQPGDDRFEGIVVSLGALGIVTRVTLAVQPYYEMSQQAFRSLELGRPVRALRC